jgi:hypothetical protein
VAAFQGISARVMHRAPWVVLGVGVSAIWVAVLLVSVFTPPLVTGTDPTVLPLGAFLSPIGGLVATWLVCAFVKSTFTYGQPAARAATPDSADTVTKLRQLGALRDSGTITDADFERKKEELLSRL